MTMQPDELRATRKDLGMTQGQLAKRLSLTPQFIGMMERGEKPISERTERALLALVGAQGRNYRAFEFSVEPAGDAPGWTAVVLRSQRWTGTRGQGQTVLYGLFRRPDHAMRWAQALEQAGNPRFQRRLDRAHHDALKAIVHR